METPITSYNLIPLANLSPCLVNDENCQIQLQEFDDQVLSYAGLLIRNVFYFSLVGDNAHQPVVTSAHAAASPVSTATTSLMWIAPSSAKKDDLPRKLKRPRKKHRRRK